MLNRLASGQYQNASSLASVLTANKSNSERDAVKVPGTITDCCFLATSRVKSEDKAPAIGTPAHITCACVPYHIMELLNDG